MSSLPETLQALLPSVASQFPDQIAVDWRGRKITYNELYTRSAALAKDLAVQGVEPGNRVAVCLNKSLDAVASMYAVHLLGAVFVPLDPMTRPAASPHS